MKKAAQGWYQASEFARLTGVTVRTLHHYDRLGLLKPSGRTAAGYRLYGQADFARLQQIVTLKFIGFPLKQIGGLLDRNSKDMLAALRLQREILEEKRRRMDLAVEAISQAEAVVASGDEPDWEAFQKIIEVINMQKDKEWMNKYYSEEALEELEGRNTPREVVEQGQRDWMALIEEVEASLDLDPASEKAQALAARWAELIEAFTGGSPAIEESVKRLYADEANWPSTFQKPYSDEAGAFIDKAMAIRNKSICS
ncbi:MAG: MerR family transcriptional regulator [Blastocatellia bacterium]|nr:MerR family transcriptional regulator [Blastocatellia bacterium]